MPAFGVYPVADALTAGDEISSTYEGRHVTLLESELIHPTHADGFVDKGDPVVFGTVALQGVGVAFKSAAAATDYIAIDTEGIWIIDVNAADDGGNRAIEGGDRLYINRSTCIVSAIATAATQVPFGYALGHIDSGATESIAVKIHWDPVDNALLDLEPLYFGDGRDCNLQWAPGIIGATEVLLLTNGAVGASGSALQIAATGVAGTVQDVGIAGYFDATYGGVAAGNWVYGFGAWLNLLGTFDGKAGFVVAAQNNGIYAPAVVECATTDLVYGMKAECITTTAVHAIYAFALNVAGPTVAAAHTAIFYSHNAESVGYTVTNRTTQFGSIGLAYVNGAGVDEILYVNVYRA